MITGKFLTSNDDAASVLALRAQALPGCGRDERDDMAIYAITFDEDGTPGSTGRLFMDDDNVATIDMVGTIAPLRGQGLGDLVMRMLLYRVLEMNLPRVKLLCPADTQTFFMRYGLTPDDESNGLIVMRAENAAINIEGSCHCKA
ncbi:MAG: GNAT family N-acetyltransferase [Candidatus Fimadaptatus sp.]|jgi:GNAT superfamily N-acetyltransferase